MRCGIALGSNMGDRLEWLREARAALERLHEGEEPPLASPVYETEPVDCEPGAPAYLNAVMEIESPAQPGALLAALRAIEEATGRPAERPRNAPRTLDLDLLYMDGLRLDDEALTLPHPRMTVRRFVLEPLGAIRPALRLPGQDATVAQLLDRLPPSPAVKPVCGPKEWAPAQRR